MNGNCCQIGEHKNKRVAYISRGDMVRNAAGKGSSVMVKTASVPIVLSMALSATALAQDSLSPEESGAQQLGVPTVEALRGDLDYAPRWQLFYPVEQSFARDWSQPMADFDFQDGRTVARVSRLRYLSLLTLAEFGRSRLFLGVNDDGWGLQFRPFSRRDDERYLEVLRMPYLEDPTAPAELEESSSNDSGPP